MAASGKRARTRTRIVEVSARLLRERGVLRAGVDSLMAEAGLTRGGFYAHFQDKAALVAEAIGQMFVESRERLFAQASDRVGRQWLEWASQRYLSERHVRAPGEGCAVPALSAEVARSDSPEVRAAFTAGIRAITDEMTHRVEADGSGTRQDALVAFALWVGAVTVARPLDDPALASELLSAARAACAAYAGPTGGDPTPVVE
jgi:TetR/AcrR family transcriptional repressor of nem operon